MHKLRALWDLQQLEIEEMKKQRMLKDSPLAVELRMIKEKIEAGQQDFKELKEQYGLLKNRLVETAKKVTQIKEQIKDLNDKIFDGSMINRKEIAGAQQRLHELSDKLSKLEDEELNLMEAQDDLRENVTGISESIKRQKEEFYKLKQLYNENQLNIKQEIQHIFKHKEQLCQDVEPQVMEQYFAMQQHINKPVAKVKNGICGGCHMGVTFDKLKLLKNKEELVKCDNCKRLLFIE